MKEKEIIEKYGIDTYALRTFLERRQLPYYVSFMGGLVVEDSIVEKHIEEFQTAMAVDPDVFDEELNDDEWEEELARLKKEKEEQNRQAREEDARKKKAMAQMLITSGFNFDGYTIKKYSGYISGDDAISVNRGMAVFGSGTNVKDELLASLTQIRRNALRELKEAAYDLGCNAVIGVDFDYITLDPQTANLSGGTTYQPYVFCVTANGNAVIIEKDED